MEEGWWEDGGGEGDFFKGGLVSGGVGAAGDSAESQ